MPSADRARPGALSSIRGQRGMAVPAAVLSTLILSTVIAGFSTLSAIEPVIAGNQLRVAQARAIAEAGVEQALWALSNPADPQGIPVVFATAPAPYDGSRFVAVAAGGRAMGGFQVAVTNGATTYEREITAVGWAPSDAGVGPSALQKITVTAVNPQLIVKDAPAALAVGGDLHAGGTVVVDARTDQSCGRKVGTLSLGDTRLGNSADIRGAADDNDTGNQVSDAGGGALPDGAGDVVTNVSSAVFDGFGLTDADLRALRAFAKARGTYLRGAVSFDDRHRLPDGLVFVDAVGDGPGASDRASVRIDGPAPADPSGVWSGWLIVNGSLSVGGDTRMKGFLYAGQGLGFDGAGARVLSGAAIGGKAGERSGAATVAEMAGDVSIAYDCRDMRTGGGRIPGRWGLKGGTYREVSGS